MEDEEEEEEEGGGDNGNAAQCPLVTKIETFDQ
jgi:hypothetical protein